MRRLVFIALAACGSSSSPRTVPSNTGPAGPAAPTTACPVATPLIHGLVADLDVNPDPLHSDFTPSVHALIAQGLAGACAVVELLVAPEQATRLHAHAVLEGVLLGEYGWRGGGGFPNEYSEEQATAALKAIWYDSDREPDELRAGAARWRAWVDGRHLGTSSPPDGPLIADMTAALDAVMPQLERCGMPVDLTVTFESSGAVSSIFGTASTDAAYRGCLVTATASVKLAPFHRTEVWTRYPWK